MSSPLPTLCVLATGGTIAGAHSGGGGYKSAALSIDSLVAAVPQIKNIAELELEQIARIGSQDMDDELWLRLAARCQQQLNRDEVAGIVITHGTDTMEETAYFLNLLIKSEKPVVLVGAMRPANAISADGPMNLLNAVAVAAHSAAPGRGVLVVANDEVHFARAVSKTNTTQVGTFKSINRGLAGLVQQGRVHWFSPPAAGHTVGTPFRLETIQQLPRVDILYAHAGMQRTFLDAAVHAGAAGLVIAGVGSGNLPAQVLAAAQEAAHKGLLVVRASRTGGGMVERNVEVDDDEGGFITAGDLNPQKARVLLQLSLTHTRSAAEIQTLFDRL